MNFSMSRVIHQIRPDTPTTPERQACPRQSERARNRSKIKINWEQHYAKEVCDRLGKVSKNLLVSIRKIK